MLTEQLTYQSVFEQKLQKSVSCKAVLECISLWASVFCVVRNSLLNDN